MAELKFKIGNYYLTDTKSILECYNVKLYEVIFINIIYPKYKIGLRKTILNDIVIADLGDNLEVIKVLYK